MAIAGSSRRTAEQSTSDESQEDTTTTNQHGLELTPSQPDLFGYVSTPRFGGTTLELADIPRLTGQLARVAELMADGQWRTLRQISEQAQCSEASASARLRDFRKERFGSHSVEGRRLLSRASVWSYRVLLRSEVER